MTKSSRSMKSYVIMLLKILMFWAVYFLGQIITGGVFGLILYFNQPTMAGDVMGFQERLSYNIPIILILSALLSLLVYWFMFIGKKKSLFKHCGFKKVKMTNIAVLTMITLGLVIFSISMLTLTELYKYAPENMEIISKAILNPSIFLSLLSIGIIIPLVEEVVYRGLIFNELRGRMNVWVALVLQAVIFGLSHGNVVQGVNTLIMGLLLGLVYLWLESLWAPIIIHILNNSLVVILSNYLSQEFETGKYVTFIMLCFGLLLVAIGVVKLRPKRDEPAIIKEPNPTLD